MGNKPVFFTCGWWGWWGPTGLFDDWLVGWLVGILGIFPFLIHCSEIVENICMILVVGSYMVICLCSGVLIPDS